MRRSAFTNALFCLLLTLAAALFSLSAGLWYSVYKTGQSLDDVITTIVLPDMFAIRRQVRVIIDNGDYSALSYVDTSNENQIIFDTAGGSQVIIENGIRIIRTYPDGYQHIHEGHYEWIRQFQQDLVQEAIMREINENVFYSVSLETDDRRVYGAYIEGLKSIPARHSEIADYDRFVESLPQSTAAFIVRCTEIVESFRLMGMLPDSGISRAYIGRFEVEQEIYLHEGRRSSRTVTAYFPYSNPDGTAPIEEGKRYIISGHRYAQGDRGPSWYVNDWLLFPSHILMPNALYITPLSAAGDLKTVGYLDAFGDLPDGAGIAVVQFLQYSDYELDDYFPMDIKEWLPMIDDDFGHEGVTWFEIDGSFEDALSSGRGQQIEDALSVAKISVNSLQVLTTNDVNSIFRFNQRVNRITGGRTLNERDNETGARVCLISDLIAEENGLSVGDMLPMQLYDITLGQLQMTATESAWIPSLYHPRLELTEPVEYEIVGIYAGLTQELRDHTISPNTVIIPASSFGGIDVEAEEELNSSSHGSRGSYAPPLLRTIIIPNGGIEEAKAEIDKIAEGFSLFFRFYDQGYARLVPIIENLNFGMSWILALSAVGWAVSIVMFSLFYTGRRIKDMSLLYGLGVNKVKCFIWVFVQCFVLVLLSHGIVAAVMLPVYESILESALAVSGEFTEIYRNFILSDMNVAGGIRFTLPLDRTPMGLIYAIAGSAAVLLVTSSLIITRATKNRWQTGREVG